MDSRAKRSYPDRKPKGIALKRAGPFELKELLKEKLTVDVGTASSFLGIGRTSAYRLAKEGNFPLPLLKLGNSYKIKTIDLARMLGVAPEGVIEQDLSKEEVAS